MNRLLAVVALGGLVAGGPSLLRAQGEFALARTEAGQGDSLTTHHNPYLNALAARPPGLRSVPEGLQDGARYYSAPVGGKPVVVIVDRASPVRVFVDAGRKGSFVEVPRVKFPGGAGECWPVEVAAPGGKGTVRVRLEVWEKYLRVTPAEYYAGEVRLGDQAYPAALVDENMDGRYDTVLDIRDGSDVRRVSDTFAIDLDGNKAFGGHFPMSGERVPAPGAFCVKGRYYTVSPSPDGSTVRVEPLRAAMGTLDTRSPTVYVALAGDGRAFCLEDGESKRPVPAGKYRVAETGLRKRDSPGFLWTLHGGLEMSEGFPAVVIAPGRTTAFPLGEPLTVKISAAPRSGDSVTLNLALVGAGGERYNPRPSQETIGGGAPPAITVYDRSGRVLATGNFRTGCGYSCWYTWPLPNGFRGRYRVELKSCYGPFDVKLPSGAWYSVD